MFATRARFSSGGGLNRVFFVGGGTSFSSVSNRIDYVSILSNQNATDFGDLSVSRASLAGTSNGSRAVCGGGASGSLSTFYNVIDYFNTQSNSGNATDFGNLSSASRFGNGSSSNRTGNRGIFAGGGYFPTYLQSIDYITITSTGNASDFGDLTGESVGGCTGVDNGTGQRMVIASVPRTPLGNANCNYITINSTGNASNYGDLTQGRLWSGGTSNLGLNRAVYSGGERWNGSSWVNSNVMDYFNLSNTNNATDFGDLISSSKNGASGSNGSRQKAVHGRGTSYSNSIWKFTISITGNATDFGDLTLARESFCACDSAFS